MIFGVRRGPLAFDSGAIGAGAAATEAVQDQPGFNPDIGEFLVSSVREFVRQEYWEEMESLAEQVSVIGGPGFTGAFSGVAPGRFAVTLNAVLS